MAESLTSELQTQLTNLWKNKNIPTWNGGYHSYSDKQIQTSIDSKYIIFFLFYGIVNTNLSKINSWHS